MKLLTTILALATLATASLNTTQMYKLKTQLKGQAPGKEAYNNLYLQGYHTGAGLSDVVLTNVSNGGINGFLNATNLTNPTGPIYNQLFDLGNPFPWGLTMVPNDVAYTLWQPVEVNAGVSGSGYTVSGFFLNDTGLQWTSSPLAVGSGSDAFGGWLVCEWWHGVVQLFFRIGGRGTGVLPGSCADVELVAEYF